MPMNEGIRYILDKEPNPQEWSSADWALELPSIKVRSFFSSHVESARFLDRMQGGIFDFLAKVRDDVTLPDGTKTTVLRVGSRADFVAMMREWMIKEGMSKPEDFKSVNQSDLTDIRSMARLELIFDTNVRQAYGFARWKQGMRPAVRRAYPAARFVREVDVTQARPRHAAHEGEMRMKTDREWWAGYQNDPLIGGFGVPWPPYGFGSGMTQEDAPRSEAIAEGLMSPDSEPESAPEESMNTGLSASTKKMDPELKKKLLDRIRQMREDLKTRPIEGYTQGPVPPNPRPTGNEPIDVIAEADRIVLADPQPPEPVPSAIAEDLDEALEMQDEIEEGDAAVDTIRNFFAMISYLRLWFPGIFDPKRRGTTPIGGGA